MKSIVFLLSLLLLIPAAALSSPATSPGNLYVRTFDASEKLRFEIVDRLNLPCFSWPRTLLTYPVRFDGVKIQPNDLVLRELQSGAELPFQLSGVQCDGGFLKFAVVNFFSDLPSGASRRFELTRGHAAPLKARVNQSIDGETIVLAGDKLSARIPGSRTFAADARVLGPILQFNRGSGWIGDSTIASPRRPVRRLTTEIIENGPLFIQARLTYAFDGGASYVATVKFIDGYDFIEFDEETHGLSKDDAVFMENAWSNFHPTHRWSLGLRAVMPIDKPHIQAFRGEDPAFTGPSQVEDPSKQMLMWMEITPSNGWSGWKEVDFWDQNTSQGMGLFIQDVARWQDHEYSIWVSTDTLRPQFRFAGGVLYWKWPLVTGTRATGVVCCNHPREDQVQDDGADPVLPTSKKINPMILRRSRYGDLSLNRLKDWQLDYPADAKAPTTVPSKGRMKNADAYDAALASCSITLVAGGMYHPVAMRDISSWIVPDFTRFASSMSPAQRQRATALLLLSAYLSAQEDYGPMITMLGGHPNFMADYKFPLMGASFLFPDHPMAREWRDQFEKFMDLSGRFYTRPPVPQWEALGGRWTESIATYNWAYLSPTLDANHLGIASDNKNRMATPWLGMMGDYLVGVLTAPVTLDAAKSQWPANTPLTVENGFRRIHPPQGAHSGKRGIPGSMYALGQAMRQYRPLTAEHLMWAGAPSATVAFESHAANPTAGPINTGTNPHLRSAKYTGYGIVLRAAVDTPDEISIFLQQVDKGPNYRWGYANQNGSGDIYYYAKGKSFSGHGFEDTGDRHADDAMYSCNTGVYKNYHYNCIGMNELTRPFYDLHVAQFAELIPAEGPGAYSWPEYKSRSVMLVGSEYIIVYDAINGSCGTRFAWNSSGVNDDLPFIHHIKGGSENIVDVASRARDKQRGVIWDVWKGGEDRMMIVTHDPDVKIIPAKRQRNVKPPPYSRIKTPTSEDCVFQDSQDIDYTSDGMIFRGTAGVIRKRASHAAEMALFHGRQIGNADITLTVDATDLGVALAYDRIAEIKGSCFGRNGGTLTLDFAAGIPAGAILYIDGAHQATTIDGRRLIAKLPPGEHRLELTARQPQPLAPQILRTENRAGGATVYFTTVAAAQNYRVEISRDGGITWTSAGQTNVGLFELKGLANGAKVHVRMIAANADQCSIPAREYPIYVTDQAPPAPDGLRVELATNQAALSWGEVLGASQYRLYRRPKGHADFAPIFKGIGTTFIDSVAGVTPPRPQPGAAANALRPDTNPIYEYAVSAVNGNGESDKSIVIDTDPTNWRNWNPDVDLRFKRQSGYWLPPYVHVDDVPPKYYP